MKKSDLYKTMVEHFPDAELIDVSLSRKIRNND